MKKTVVVIGSGIAGTLLCNKLVHSFNVVLLEIGEKDIIRYPNINFISKRLATFNTFCYSGGGGSNLWHNGLIPINKDDVISSDFADILADARIYTDEAAKNLHFNSGSYEEKYLQITNQMHNLANSLNTFSDGIDCLVYPNEKAKLRPIDTVIQHYRVKNIEFNSKENKIDAIIFNKNGIKHEITCDEVIISAGTFGTPELVHRALDSVGAPSESAGTGLIDHPAGFVGKVKFKKHALETMQKFANSELDNFSYCTGIRIKSNCGKYTGFAFFRPALSMSNNLAIYKYKSLLAGSHGVQRIKKALSLKIFHPDILLEVISHIFGISIPTKKYNILIYFQQRKDTNSVSYSSEKINIDWNISSEELEIYNNILEKLHSHLRPVADEINIQNPITKEWLRSGAHHSGTMPLGEKETDIIDNDLKIKAIKNAHVCDGSVIQEHSYANTGLTIAQLALRLANHISNRLK